MAVIWLLFIILILIGIPVAFVIGGISIIMLVCNSTTSSIAIVQKMVNGLDSFTLLAIPFFICLAQVMTTSKIADKIFSFANAMVRHIPGGLAQVNILASIIMAGMSGNAVNDIVGIGPIEVRAMEKEGYDRPFAGSVTAASSAIGPIIPPSVPIVLIGSITGASISKMLLGGIVPGLLIALLLMIYVFFISKAKKYPVFKKVSGKERLKSLKDTFPALLMPIILIAGFLSGYFTPTESACIAVIYAIFLGFFVYKKLSLKKLIFVFENAAMMSATTLLIISCASVFGLVITQQQIPQKLTSTLISLSNNPNIILLLMVISLVILGMFLESTAIMIIMTPILMVVANKIGMDMVHFGVLEAVVITTGLFTPPVGVGMFLTCKVCHIKTSSFLKSFTPFLVILFICILLIMYVPNFVLWLPNLLIK